MTFAGHGSEGPVIMVYVTCPRRRVPALLAIARGIDSGILSTVERTGAWSNGRHVIAQPTGWRAFWKKK
jgi:hypothetical protein